MERASRPFHSLQSQRGSSSRHFSFSLSLAVLPLQAEEGGALSYPAWVDAAAQASKPLIGGPRSYYLSLFNDDTVYFDRSNYPEQSEAERVALEHAAMRAPVLALEGGEESKEEHAGAGSALARRAHVGPRAARPLPLAMQDSVLVDAEVIYPGDTISIKRLLHEGPGFQPGDLHIGRTNNSRPSECACWMEARCPEASGPLRLSVHLLNPGPLVSCPCDSCRAVGRIFAKSRINNFGRNGASRVDQLRAPFNFELVIGDSSREQIKIVLWNTLVGAYFHRLHVGQVVAVRGFRLKPARADQQLELALNPYNPMGSVRVFSDADGGLAPSLWERVPPIVMTVSTVAQVATMPDGSIFDLAGVVTFAGPMRREFAPSKKQSGKQFAHTNAAEPHMMVTGQIA